MSNTYRTFLACGFALLGLATSAMALDFAPKKTVDGLELNLNGTGLRKATVFGIKVYEAGLYIKAKTHVADEVLAAPLPKYLELRFVRDVEAEKMRGAWLESFKNNNTSAEYQVLEARLQKLNTGMKDIKEGQALTFTFLKNGKTLVQSAGTDVATIEGEDFQKAMLKVWMGPKPPNEELKSGLLSL